MHRFFVDKESIGEANSEICIAGEDVNHIKNVLRLKCGDDILVSDGLGMDYQCRIKKLSSDKVIAGIEDVFKNCAELSVRITLFQGMPKSDKMEFIIQKAVELGASEIVPVMTERTVVKLDEKKAAKKVERYNGIAISAGKQSGRGVVPVVSGFMDFKQAVSYAADMDMMIIPYEQAEGIDYSKKVISEIYGKKSLGVFIGPEGGFSKSEIEYATSKGAKCITLGNRILRTETAGLTTLSIIMFFLER